MGIHGAGGRSEGREQRRARTIVDFRLSSGNRQSTAGRCLIQQDCWDCPASLARFLVSASHAPDAAAKSVNLREDFPLRIFPQRAENETGLKTIGGSEFFMDGAPVSFQGPRGNSELFGNDLVRHSGAGREENFLLAAG